MCKNFKLYYCLIMAAVIAVAAIIGAGAASRSCAKKDKTVEYAESVETLNNPDQGFYRPVYTKVTKTEVKPNGNIKSAARLYHLRMDISAFSSNAGGEDIAFTDEAAQGFENLLSDLKSREKNAVIRFAYAPNFGDMKDAEPPLEIMKGHIRKICSVINKFESVVTAVEVGMIGPWGEMHSSAIAKPEYISPLIDEYLSCTQNIAILVRTPKMIYDYLDLTGDEQIKNYTVPTDKTARLGLFNDGYLGSANDLGTYADRERDVEFLSKRNSSLPYGGEAVIPDSPLHDIQNCTPEMYALKLSYLNVEWNDKVIEKWKNTYYTEKCGEDKRYYGKSAFTYIENRMGYRFVLRKSELNYGGGKLSAKLKIDNVGFGNMFKKKFAEIIVADGAGNEVFLQKIIDYRGESAVEFDLNCNLTAGVYGVYMRIYGDELGGRRLYTVRFANDGIFDDNLKANKLGQIEV